ncbi:MAG: DEAD/DEAH box helicase [Alphaproteobacteria bacterium]|nr:DEAD/DEAH box helicase [Alphaproteobacteria bacterium]
MTDVFLECQEINELLETQNEAQARNKLIKLLDHHEKENIPYSELLNHLIRKAGLYPYLQPESARWDDQFVYEAFKVDTGRGDIKTLHREQSHVLKRIIEGQSVAISAPTSFGKSFIIDSFIALKSPKTIVIIVPTIALMDETRRRLYKKFSDKYKIITTTEAVLSENNIFIFPQERALHYVDKIEAIDLLIVDEFYKASISLEKSNKDRSLSLIRAIMKLGEKAAQRYFLAPNIKEIENNAFTQGMDFVEMLDFNTVFLEKHDLYTEIGKDIEKKKSALLEILRRDVCKTLIYAGTYVDIDRVATLIQSNYPAKQNALLENCAKWLEEHYDANWGLAQLIRRGTGVHNGRLHRALSQIQVHLFEEENGLDNIVSTSSIIEGVNTSAENVIVWRNKNGSSKLTDFSYKNIIGRGGRMFRHFIGRIYILEAPPTEENTKLDIPFPDNILMEVDETKLKTVLSEEQIKKIILHRQEMKQLIGSTFEKLLKENAFQTTDIELIKKIATDIKTDPDKWNGLSFLNSDDPAQWDRLLYAAMGFQAGDWDIEYRKFVAFVKALSRNWSESIPELLDDLAEQDIDIEKFFTLEKNVSYKLSALMSDISVLHRAILGSSVDISPFISKLSHAFLPSVVFQLEEYGLPRMISKKLHEHKVINFLDRDLTVHTAIETLNKNKVSILEASYLDEFDRYIMEYFYDGITLSSVKQSLKSV